MPKHSPKFLLSSSFPSLFVLLLVVSSSVAHSSQEQSYARRSLTRKRQPAPVGKGLPVGIDVARRAEGDDNLLDILLGGVTSILPATSTSLSSSSTSSSSDPTSQSTTSQSSSSQSTSSTQTTTDTGSTTLTSDTSTTSPTGGILDPVTSGLGDLTSILGGGSTSTTTSSSATETDTSTSQGTDQPATTPTSTSTTSTGILDPVTSGLGDLTSILDPPTTTPTSSDPTVTDPPVTSTSPSGGILDPVTSGLGDLTSILDPTTTTTTSEDPATTTSEDPATTTTISQDPTITPAPETSTSPSGGIIDTLTSGLGDLTTILNPNTTTSEPPTITDGPTSGGPASDGPTSGGPTSDGPTSGGPTSDGPTSGGPTSDGPTSGGPTSDGPTSGGPTSDGPTSGGPTSNGPSGGPTDVPSGSPNSTITDGPSISFPSGRPSGSGSETITSTPVSTITQPPVTVESDFSFLLTQSQLAFTSAPTPTDTQSFSDPDQAPTTASHAADTVSTAPFSAAAFPSGLPLKIYPKNRIVEDDAVIPGFTLITILFNQELNWKFVVEDDIAGSQILGFMPLIIDSALHLTDTRKTKTYLLQAYKPSSYRGPQDASSLGTLYLGYIPTDQVNDLAAMIQARNSPFYTGVNNEVAKQLAVRVDSGYSLLSQPESVEGPSSGSNASNTGGSTADRTRQDAIIGVVSAIGGIALIVLAILAYRWYKRNQEQKHRRLSDPPVGYRPDGREFDQDSIGGQRRRSFYFAEDSLRGFQDTQPEYTYNAYNDQPQAGPSNGMVQRRPVAGAISQPILTQSSMNW